MSENIISNHAVALTSTSKSDCWRSWPFFGLGLTGIFRFLLRHFLNDSRRLNDRCEGNLIFIYSLWVARYGLIIFSAKSTFWFIDVLLRSRRAWQIESLWLPFCLDIDRTDCLVSYYINQSILFYDIELTNIIGVLNINLYFFDLMLFWHISSTVVTTVIWSFVTLVKSRWVSRGWFRSWSDCYRLGSWSLWFYILRLFVTTLSGHIIVHLNILFLFCFFKYLALNFWLLYWLLLFFILYLIFWYLVVLTNYKLDRLSALFFFKFWFFLLLKVLYILTILLLYFDQLT